MNGRFDNKVVIVTGATSGIGKTTAEMLAAEGAKVALAARRRDRGEQLVKDIKQAGGDAFFIETDLSQPDSIENMVEATVAHFGRLDYAFNNAGIPSQMIPLADIELDEWESVIRVNLTGIFLCMKYQIPELIKNGGGAIVNNASLYGLRGAAGTASYGSSKHGIVGMTKSAALDYAAQGIRVNAICVGFAHSEMLDPYLEVNPEFKDMILSQVPMGRIADSREVGSVVLWMLSDESSFVTGQAVSIDGGLTAK